MSEGEQLSTSISPAILYVIVAGASFDSAASSIAPLRNAWMTEQCSVEKDWRRWWMVAGSCYPVIQLTLVWISLSSGCADAMMRHLVVAFNVLYPFVIKVYHSSLTNMATWWWLFRCNGHGWFEIQDIVEFETERRMWFPQNLAMMMCSPDWTESPGAWYIKIFNLLPHIFRVSTHS